MGGEASACTNLQQRPRAGWPASCSVIVSFFLSFFYNEEVVQHAGFGVFIVTIRKDWETEPVFKSGVDHCVDWWQRTRGDPIPGFKYWNGSTYVSNHV